MLENISLSSKAECFFLTLFLFIFLNKGRAILLS